MKYIKKGSPPKVFSDWLILKKNIIKRYSDAFNNEPDAQKKGTHSANLWKELQNPEKEQVWLSLIKEQGGICAYCGLKLNPQKVRIEHLEAKSKEIKVTLDYTNLVAVCNSQHYLDDYAKHCDVSRGDKDIHIYPTNPICDSMFSYDYRGYVTSNHPGIQETIAILKLGTIKDEKPHGNGTLIEKRRSYYKAVNESIDYISKKANFNKTIIKETIIRKIKKDLVSETTLEYTNPNIKGKKEKIAIPIFREMCFVDYFRLKKIVPNLQSLNDYL
jgi:uncharacterized protein (TIGR02646 family)